MKRLVAFILVGVFSLSVCSIGLAQDSAEIKDPQDKTCAEDFPRHIGNDLKYTFWNGWHLLAIAVGSGAIAGLHEADPNIQRKFQSRPLGSTFDDVMKWGFNPFILAGESLLALGLTELVFDSPKVARTAGAMFEALMLTETMTLSLQLMTHRRRPDDSGNKSFPSAHTSGVFSLAGVTWGLYGPWYGIPAMAIASLVGVSRIDSNRHVATDVAAGALLGTLVGLGTAKFHQGRYSQYFLVPTVSEKSASLSLARRF